MKRGFVVWMMLGFGAAIALAAYPPVTPGTSGYLWIGQGANSAPAFEPLSGDCTITSSGAITCTKINGNTPGNTCTNQVETAISSSAVGTCSSLSQAMASSGFHRSIVGSGTAGTAVVNNATEYFSVLGESATPQTSGNEVNAQSPMPVAATVLNLRCAVLAAPGGSASYAFTFRDNAASPASGPTCTITGAATTCSDGTHSATLAAGDLINMMVVPASTPAASAVKCSVEVDI